MKPVDPLEVRKEDIFRYPNRIIVAGSRSFVDYVKFQAHLTDFLMLFEIKKEETVFITGDCPLGPDAMILDWAKEHGWKYVKFPADWDDLTVPGAIIKQNIFGKSYNANAGFAGNEQMASVASHLFAIIKNNSPGTKDMIQRATKKQLVTLSVIVKKGNNHEKVGQF